ncbi:MAG: hypothetical protein ACYTGQ_15035 [Planctomycetota bacterium]
MSALRIALMVGLVGVALVSGCASQSWGDQGDGTYRNPILNGDYPD